MSESVDGGLGGRIRSDRVESGLTGIKEQRMINRAIRNGWLKGQRWLTEATPRELQEKQAAGQLTMKEQAAASVFLDLTHDLNQYKSTRAKLTAMRLRQSAVRNVIAMEAQNQDDDLAELKAEILGEQAKGLSAEVLASLLSEVGQQVAELVGEDRAREFVAELQERITVDTTSAGTLLTPDMEAAAMDATIPDHPKEGEA